MTIKPMRRQPEKPNLIVRFPCVWDGVEPFTFEKATRGALLDELKKGGMEAEDQRDSFLGFCQDLLGQFDGAKRAETAGKIEERLLRLQEAAAKMLELLGPETLPHDTLRWFELQAQHSEWSVLAPVPWPERVRSLIDASPEVGEVAGLASLTWDVMSTFESTCRQAITRLDVDRLRRDAAVLGRQLCGKVLIEFHSRTGKVPPVGHEGWFCRFMEDLGKTVGVQSGAKIVQACVDEFVQHSVKNL